MIDERAKNIARAAGAFSLLLTADVAHFTGAGLLRLMGLDIKENLPDQVLKNGARFRFLSLPAAFLVVSEAHVREVAHGLAQKGGNDFPEFLTRRITDGVNVTRRLGR